MRVFKLSLYEEHLEEISFLYEHRCGALRDAEYSLLDLGDIDERIEAHLDALVLGEELALTVVQSCLAMPDSGELYTAARLFCRSDRADLVLDCLGQLDWNDSEAVSGMLAGLKCDLPVSWTQTIAGWLRDFHPRLTALLAEAAGHRRLQVATELQAAVTNADAELSPLFLRALGLLRQPSTMMVLYAHMQKPDPKAARTAAIAALRFGDANVVSNIMNHALPWSVIPLALVGDARVFKYVQQQLVRPRAGSPINDAATALGLLGDVRAIEPLIGSLANPELASSAASSLFLLTGAPLHEDITIESLVEEEESIGEDEPDETELPEQPATYRRLSTDPQVWAEWWSRNQDQFGRLDRRYRLGHLYSPSVSVTALQSTLLPLATRELIADELVARHGVDACYAPELPVREQLSALASIEAQITQTKSRTPAGQWQQPGRG